MPIFSSQLGKVESYNPEQSIKTMANHLRKIQEELEYRLMNLDSTNINEINVSDTNVLVEGKPIQNVLQDQDGNYSMLQHTVEGLSSAVADQFGQISTLVQTADGLRTQVSNMEGNVSTLTQTANGLQTQVTSLAGNVSTLTQTANGLKTQVSNMAGDISSLEQTSNSVLATVYDMQDDVGHMLKLDSRGVYIVDNEGNRVSIHGGQLEAGTVYADYLLGTTVGLMTSGNNTAGGIEITGASTSTYAVELYSNGALRLQAHNGAAYLGSDEGAGIEVSTRIWCNNHIYPSGPDEYNCGNANYPWAMVYSTNGMCETSDRKKKKDIEYGLDSMDGFFDDLQPSSYRMVNGTSGRKHCGFVAQDIKSNLDKHSISTKDFGGYVADVDKDGNEVLGLRYSEFIPLIVDQVQKLKARVAGLEGKKK